MSTPITPEAVAAIMARLSNRTLFGSDIHLHEVCTALESAWRDLRSLRGLADSERANADQCLRELNAMGVECGRLETERDDLRARLTRAIYILDARHAGAGGSQGQRGDEDGRAGVHRGREGEGDDMSRSGYSEDCEYLGLWRGAVTSAIRGKRGQAFLREMAQALDAMPVKELVADDVVRDSEHVCGLGSVALARGLDVTHLDIENGDAVGQLFGIASAMAREIAFVNDDDFGRSAETPAERWVRMRAWVQAEFVES